MTFLLVLYSCEFSTRYIYALRPQPAAQAVRAATACDIFVLDRAAALAIFAQFPADCARFVELGAQLTHSPAPSHPPCLNVVDTVNELSQYCFIIGGSV
jgi:hypothetical protein